MNADTAQVDYLRWLSAAAPSVFDRVKDTFPTMLGELGWIQAVVQVVAAIGSAVMAKKQQDKQNKLQKKAQAAADAETARIEKELASTLVQVNTARAQRGQPPVDAKGNVIASATLPMPSQLSSYYGQSSGVSTNTLLVAGAGVAAVLLLARR